jgi:fructose-1,6-bisphosphatase/inositol monophosphatase family enzyme
MTRKQLELFFNKMSEVVFKAGEYAKENQGKVENVGKTAQDTIYRSAWIKDAHEALTIVDTTIQEMLIKAAAECLDIHSITLDAEEDTTSLSLFPHKQLDTVLVIDPLDGTYRYLSGSSLFSVNVGIVHKGKIICTLLYFPAMDKMYVVNPDGKAMVNKKETHVKTSQSKKIYVNNRVTDEIRGKLKNGGYDVIDDEKIGWPDGISNVMNGQYMAAIFHSTQIRDILLGGVLEASGGYAFDWEGNELVWPQGGRVARAVFGGGKVDQKIIECLRE